MPSAVRTFLAAAVLFLIAACSPAVMSGVDEPGPAEAGAVREVPAYRLGSADKLRISVFGEEALSGEFLVNGSGQVSMPLIGEVQASGLTLPRLLDRAPHSLTDQRFRRVRSMPITSTASAWG